MCYGLTPKYISGQIKAYSGKCALDWINDYVVLEAKMMLRYTGDDNTGNIKQSEFPDAIGIRQIFQATGRNRTKTIPNRKYL